MTNLHITRTEQEYHSFSELLDLPDLRFTKRNNKSVRYAVNCASFDIETSSFYMDNQKCACMYLWAMAIDDFIIVGRTWDEFTCLIDMLVSNNNLDPENRLIVFVHNLGYEFQFIRKRFTWYKVFASEVRKPIYAITETGIEFRCSLFASGYSLESLAEQIDSVKKLVGDLDYSLPRHSGTFITDKELQYVVNDVKIVIAWERLELETYKKPHRIPITKTGKVRAYIKRNTIHGHDHANYRELIKTLTLSPEVYRQLKRAFMGGFTHANPCNALRVLSDVHSYDITSDYPTQMIMQKFPMSAPEFVRISGDSDFRENLKNYCCLFDVQFINLQSKILFENYMSRSRCRSVINDVCANGRIVSADSLITTLTEQDFYIIEQCYTWDSMRVCNFHRFKKDYLPAAFRKAILKLYQDKTKLKGDESRKKEYQYAKELLNSAYGCCVTDICRTECSYTDRWEEKEPVLEEVIEKYNTNKNRFLYYPFGVWVTAHARRTLWTAILHLKQDYVYSDTDSVKFLNYEKHKDFFVKFNEYITHKLDVACWQSDINPEWCRPKNLKGEVKQLGVWDYEGKSDKFKTLGAKRYLGMHDSKLHLTASGVHKEKGAEYLKQFNDPFEHFDDELTVDADHTKKLTHIYIDERRRGTLTDYRGVSGEFDELSAVHLEPSSYTLSTSQHFINFVNKVKEVENGI